jgi:hypothetical protein
MQLYTAIAAVSLCDYTSPVFGKSVIELEMLKEYRSSGRY